MAADGAPDKVKSLGFNVFAEQSSVLRQGGNYDPWVEEGVAITCCTDGIRPVSFKLERID